MSPPPKAEIDTRTIISALHHLCRRGPGGVYAETTTADEIAKHLRVPVTDVEPLLRELERKRLAKSRRRKSGKTWEPWS